MRRCAALLIVLAACGDDSGGSKDGGISGERETVVEAPAHPKLDVLFVIDDSVGADEHQRDLGDAFPTFLDALGGVGNLPDLHLGVVTSDMGTKASSSATPADPVGTIGNGGCDGFGKAGKLQLGTATPADVTGNFIFNTLEADGTRTQNYTGELPVVFSKMAKVGAGGCGFEQPLAAMRAALDNNAANAGFLRTDAELAVVFVQDEDDCSVMHPGIFGQDVEAFGPRDSFRCTHFGVTCQDGGATPTAMNAVGAKTQCTDNATSTFIDPIAGYADYLKSLKGGDTNRLLVAAIAGNPDLVAVALRPPAGGGEAIPTLAHSCTYMGEPSTSNPTGTLVADPAVRMKTFLDQFPNRAAFATVCQADLSSGLDAIAGLARDALSSCLKAPLADVDAAMAGDQNDCLVDDVVGTTATPIAACDASLTPTCWHLVVDATACATAPGGLKLEVLRAGAPAAGTTVRMRCHVQH